MNFTVAAVDLDNTNTTMGDKSSLKSRILAKNNEVFIAGCNCHLAHPAAYKGSDRYPAKTGFDCEDNHVDLHYSFK